MSCQITTRQPIFIVRPVSRDEKKSSTYYIFMGPQHEDIILILNNFSETKRLKKSELNSLNNLFGDETINQWIGIIKKGGKLSFIPNLIRMDDSLNEVKKKIFVYCSQNEDYILPRNQELWIKLKMKSKSKSTQNITNKLNPLKYKILGYHYIDKQTGEEYKYAPHIYFKDIEFDNDLLKTYQRMDNEMMMELTDNSSKKKREYKIDTSENYYLMYDILENVEMEDNIIYVSNAIDEILYLKNKKKIMNEKKNRKSFLKVLNGYLRKYWIHIQPEFDKKEAKGLFELKRFEIERDEYILKLMKEVQQSVVNTSYFQNCSMKTVKFNINSSLGTNDFGNNENGNETSTNQNEILDQELERNNIDYKGLREKEMDFVDLYQLFDYIREKKINVETPYVKYGDVTIDDPFIIISLEAIRQGRLSKNLLYEWLNLIKRDERRFNGLQLKRFIKNFDDEPKYSSINIARNGKMTVSISFKEDNNANIKDIEMAIKNCKKLIDDLNQHIPDYRLIRGISDNKRIRAPDMNVSENGIIEFAENTKLTFLNMIISMRLPVQLNFAKLKDFSMKFPQFISQEPSLKKKFASPNSKNEIIKNSLKIRYNRVSSFANMNEILVDIDKVHQKGSSDPFILELIMKKYGLTLEEAKHFLITYKKDYSALGKGKTDSQFKIGVRVQIFQNKIIFDGITNVYQVPELYQFFTFFIFMFLNSEERSRVDRDFRKYFDKSTGNIVMVNSIKNEIDLGDDSDLLMMGYNQNLYLQELEGLDAVMINKEFEKKNDKKLFDEMMDFNVENSTELNIKNKVDQHMSTRGTVLAKDNDLDINIRLDCGNDRELEEVQTCEDFCNDSYYFIRRLQLYDNALFKFNILKNKSETQYSRCCQSNDQPVVLDYDPNSNPRVKKESFTFTMQYSSDPQIMKRWYICPKIWCPYCEIPIAEKDIDRRTIAKKLMKGEKKFCVTCACPYGDHQAFIRDQDIMTYEQEKRFKEELKKLKTNEERMEKIKEREKMSQYSAYPTFARQKNPNGLCLPCCSKKPHNVKGSGKYEAFMRCLGEEVQEEEKDDGQIYIKKSVPVDRNRYGIIPAHVARLLNTTVETGPLGTRSGYFRKGIKQGKQSFLNAIADIVSCEKITNPIPVDKLKKNLVDKLDEKMFRSIYGGNLIQVFTDKTKNTDAFENFKQYVRQNEQDIQHDYLWDYLQRPGILYDTGINIFIFDDNTLICPLGENVSEFYVPGRKNIMLVKHKSMYEPIYYLDGDGKGARVKCLYDTNRPEIEKLHEMMKNGCSEKGMISWEDVLQNSIKKYGLNQKQISLDMGESLMMTLEKILIAIKKNQLKMTFMPIKQYVDGYNKVFGICLKNGLFVPVKPSKLYTDLPYEELIDLDNIDYLDYETTKRYLYDIGEKTGMKCKVVEKIIDRSGMNSPDIIAVVLENDRIIPVKRTRNRNDGVRESNRKFYTDVDYYIQKEVDYIPDKRIEMMNRKNYEDESYQRLRFEISRYIQNKKNQKDWKNKILQVINMDGVPLSEKRKVLYQLLQEIIRKIAVVGDRDIDINTYRKPNKRVPCFQRSITEERNNRENQMSCSDDPHCIVDDSVCKLYIHRMNLLERGRDNEIFYLDRIVEELLRYPLKRNEIIYDNISSVIDKELLIIDPKKYILMHGETYVEMMNILENIYLDRTGIQLNKRPLYEQFVTQNYVFVKDKYLKTSTKLVNESLLQPIPTQWEPFLNSTFKMQKNTENSLFISLSYALRELTTNNNFTSKNIQIKIAETLELIKENKGMIKKLYHIMNPECEGGEGNEKEKEKNNSKKKNLNNNNNTRRNSQMEYDENVLVNLYRNQCRKLLSHVQSFEGLIHEITGDKHIGCEMDILLTSYMMNVNIIVLDRFKHKEAPKFYCVGQQFDSGFSKYILLYKTLAFDKNIYFILESKGKYVFENIDLPFEFRNNIIDKCGSHSTFGYEC